MECAITNCGLSKVAPTSSCATTSAEECFSQQARASTLIVETIDSRNSNTIVLSGYAGTGKTYLIGQLVRYFRSIERPFVLMAPTGRAAKVLATRTGAQATTIHKKIYAMDDLKEYVEKDVDGSETFKFYFDLKNSDDDARTVYIVDEASMVPDHYSEAEFFRFGSGHLLADLVKYINFDNNDHQKKLILVGDPAQLPPVGSNTSPALDPAYLKVTYGLTVNEFELTEVVRQRAGSGILDNATAIRNAITSARLTSLDISVDKPDVRPVSQEDLLRTYVGLGDDKPADKAIIVALSNQQVNDYNKMVRAHYFPGAVGPVKGDRLLVVANNYQAGVALMNGDYIPVDSVAAGRETRTVTLKNQINGKVVERQVALWFREITTIVDSPANGPVKLAMTVIENILDSRERELSSDEQKALYIDFRTRHRTLKPGTTEFKEAIRSDRYFNAVRVKYGYAVTCHKAQGGEWPTVFVDFTANCGYFNMGYFRWVYTAITRAREMLYTINAPHFDAITLQANAVAGSLARNVREDVLVLPAALMEAGTVPVLPGNNPFLGRIFLAVFSLLNNRGIVIDKVTSHAYCEHYLFRRGEERTRCLLHYNSDRVVTSVRPASREPGGLSGELVELLSQLEGKYIVLEGDAPASGTETPRLEVEHEYMQDAYRILCKRIRDKDIHIGHVAALSPYCLRCEFGRNGHKAGIDYHFSAKGRLTSVSPLRTATTSEELLSDLVALSNRGDS